MPPLPHGLRLLLAALVVLSVGCDAVGPVNEPPPPPPAEPAPLATLLGDNGDFDTFAAVARELGLSGGATTLAPDDEAFALASPESLDGLRRAGVLSKVAQRHVLTEPLNPDALRDGDQLATAEGTAIPVRIDDEGTVFLGEARLEGLIGSTPSGPVYRISRVLRDHLTVRERLAASPILSSASAAFAATGVDLSRPGTYFVPVNAGYERVAGGLAPYLDAATRSLARKTLQALYVPGDPLTVAELRARGQVQTGAGSSLDITERDGRTVLGRNEARILASGVAASGAVIHLVDVAPQGHLTLMERLDFLPDTERFSQLIRRAGLAETLNGPGPYTVFAAVEAGFDSLGTRGVAAVLNEEPLTNLLGRFHVAPGDVPSAELVNGRDVATLSDQSVRVRPSADDEGGLTYARARPTEALDLPASNGRLHLVRSLLNPTVSPYDQLALSGFGLFRAVAERADYRALLEGDSFFSLVAPASISDQYLQPGFECRARSLVEDHLLPNQGSISPMSTSFSTLSGASLSYSFSANTFTLRSGEDLLGTSRALYVNAPLRNGGRLHGSAGRLRGGSNPNLPPC